MNIKQLLCSALFIGTTSAAITTSNPALGAEADDVTRHCTESSDCNTVQIYCDKDGRSYPSTETYNGVCGYGCHKCCMTHYH